MDDDTLPTTETLNEADTCRNYVTPRLQAAGWEAVPHSLVEQYVFTAGRIQIRGQKANRAGASKFCPSPRPSMAPAGIGKPRKRGYDPTSARASQPLAATL